MATYRPPIGKIAARSAYDMFSWYKYLIVNLVLSHLGFWCRNLFLIAPFPDLCLLVPFNKYFDCGGRAIAKLQERRTPMFRNQQKFCCLIHKTH